MKKIIILTLIILVFSIKANAQEKLLQGLRISCGTVIGEGLRVIVTDSAIGLVIGSSVTKYPQTTNFANYTGQRYTASFRYYYPELISKNIGSTFGLGLGFAKHNIGVLKVYRPIENFQIIEDVDTIRAQIIVISREAYQLLYNLQLETAIDFRIYDELKFSCGIDFFAYKKPFDTYLHLSSDTLYLKDNQEIRHGYGKDYVEHRTYDEPFGMFYMLPNIGLRYMFGVGNFKLIPELQLQYTRNAWLRPNGYFAKAVFTAGCSVMF